jgi:2-polyprenyl-6-methoxyphenol hydroxylase-like FAD-dependent oxidoreductase
VTHPATAARRGGTQVVVVGAGPVGLLLAAELRRARVRVVVVERLATPMTESRASQLNTRTAELLHERGFDALLAEAVREPTTHFAGFPLDLSGLPSEYAGNWKVPQYRTEAVLGRRAERLGAVLRRGHELREITESGDHVVCGLDGPAGKLSVRAQYVVGCDGASSTVRRLGGFGTSSAPATKEMFRADVTGLEIPSRRFERLERGLAVAATRGGVTRVMVHEFGGVAAPRTPPPRFPDVARVWETVTGDDISAAQATWVDSFDNCRGQATRYRHGRVILAGDAAHWHLPIGGQALNVGLQDAVNLGWKLAGSVRGWAPPSLLDSYHGERHPVAAKVLATVAAQEILLLGGTEVEPLRGVFAEVLGLGGVRDRLAQAAGGLDIEYGGGDHPSVGRRMPNVELSGKLGVLTTAEAVAGAEGAILRLAGRDADRSTGGAGTVALASGCRVRVVHVPARTGVFGGVSTVLLRPDGYIAWAGDDEAGLRSALARWFGAPLHHPP